MDMPISAVILAGGYSSRMGRSKAELLYRGKSFLQHQTDKLFSLGIRDIVVSGWPESPPGTRFVPDVYPHRGPLSGVHAGLLAVQNHAALILPVDTPLVPAAFLQELIAAHRGGITLAALQGEPEPLIGVYDSTLSRDCELLLRSSGSSMRRLFRRVPVRTLEFSGDPSLLLNCNTPEEYETILQTE